MVTKTGALREGSITYRPAYDWTDKHGKLHHAPGLGLVRSLYQAIAFRSLALNEFVTQLICVPVYDRQRIWFREGIGYERS